MQKDQKDILNREQKAHEDYKKYVLTSDPLINGSGPSLKRQDEITKLEKAIEDADTGLNNFYRQHR